MASGRSSGVVRVLAAAAVIAGWAAIAVVTWPGGSGPHRSHDPLVAPVIVQPGHRGAAQGVPLLVGPITYFNTSCGNCHGDYGSLLAEELDPIYTVDGALRRVTEEMVLGPAKSQLADREIEALTAYRRSLLDGRPFLAWTGFDGDELRGEVTPGASVALTTRHGTTAAAVAGHRWSATVSPDAGEVTVRADLNGEAAVLPIPAATFTHGRDTTH